MVQNFGEDSLSSRVRNIAKPPRNTKSVKTATHKRGSWDCRLPIADCRLVGDRARQSAISNQQSAISNQQSQIYFMVQV
jgi:hypothetical protein